MIIQADWRLCPS